MFHWYYLLKTYGNPCQNFKFKVNEIPELRNTNVSTSFDRSATIFIKISFEQREMSLNERYHLFLVVEKKITHSLNWQKWQYFNNDIKIIAMLNE